MLNFLLEIDPVAFQLFGFEIRWYALCILTGALITLFTCQRIMKSYGYGKEILSDMFIYAFLGGLVGARLWYIIANFHEFLNAGNIFDIVWAMIRVWDGGLAIQGGVILGVICGVWFAYKYYPDDKKYPKRLLADIIIPNILIAQVAGRWGNFFNKEVYGKCVAESEWEFLPDFILEQMSVCGGNGKIAVPLFLIEGTINFIGWILITFVLRYLWTKRKDGYLTALYFIWYGVVRLVLEPFRDNMFKMSITEGGIHTSMVMSALFVIGGIIYILIVNYNEKRKDTYSQVDNIAVLKRNNYLTLGISSIYFASKTARYLSRDLDNNNYRLDCFMLAVCPFYSVKFYEKYGKLCHQELVDNNIEVGSLEDFLKTLKTKSLIPFAVTPYFANYMNALYESNNYRTGSKE